MEGKHLPDRTWGVKADDEHYELGGDAYREPGVYWWCRGIPDGVDRLYFIDPTGVFGAVSPKIHTITDNADGTITVEPSILRYAGGPREDGTPDLGWHGYLENGVWRTV